MYILAINCGSSTLKFQLFESIPDAQLSWGFKLLARGNIDRIGETGTMQCGWGDGNKEESPIQVRDHARAMEKVFAWLKSKNILVEKGLAVGHRVVHGGTRFSETTLINDQVLQELDKLGELAPLHNRPSVEAIRGARAFLGPSVPMAAVFDTAFHHTMPAHAARYAIPGELADKHGIRRFGFHGTAHRYMAERYTALTGQALHELNLITLQLGNGCSAAAIQGGRSVDTSMGFTPLEGLVMGSRSGDVDPSLAGFLAGREGRSIEEVENWLNTRSGLLGVSGRSKDMRELLEAEKKGDVRSGLAVDMFCYRVRKYIGSYLAVLGGAHAVIFGGGIGENAPAIRSRVCSEMDWCGLTLDPEKNQKTIGRDGSISIDRAKIQVFVIAVDEGVLIARETAALV